MFDVFKFKPKTLKLIHIKNKIINIEIKPTYINN